MGSGEWIQQRQEIRQDAVNTAYKKTKPKKYIESIEVKPDIYDQIYVGLRSILPDWMLLLFIFIGAITTCLVLFKKQIKDFFDMWVQFLKWKKDK